VPNTISTSNLTPEEQQAATAIAKRREGDIVARQAWLTVEAQFLSNLKSNVLQIYVNFCIFKQEDISVIGYCCKMKGMIDGMHTLGKTIIDYHLVLNLLRDLNNNCNHMKSFIKRTQSLLSFHTICNDLTLEEIELDNSAA
jgi:hypothetical protein